MVVQLAQSEIQFPSALFRIFKGMGLLINSLSNELHLAGLDGVAGENSDREGVNVMSEPREN